MLTAEKLVRNSNRIRDRATGPAPDQSEQAPSAEPRTPRNRQPTPALPGRLTQQEFADRCEVSLRTVKRWSDQRKDPAKTTIGRKVFYTLAAIAEWEGEREEKRNGRKR